MNFLNNKFPILIIVLILSILFFSYYYYMRRNIKRVVVFDLDETLGCFVQFGIFCDAIEKFYKRPLTDNEFISLLDLYPEYLRPHILSILNYLKINKQKRELYKVYLYTNNQGPKDWARKICKYLEYKINYKLFNQLIGAYKVNNRIVEPTRTTYEKTLSDFLNTTNLPNNTEICFIDDLYHDKMDHSNVLYVHLDPYTKILPISTLANRYVKHYTVPNKSNFNQFIQDFMSRYNLNDIQNPQFNMRHHNANAEYLKEQLEIFLHKPDNRSRKLRTFNNKRHTFKHY